MIEIILMILSVIVYIFYVFKQFFRDFSQYNKQKIRYKKLNRYNKNSQFIYFILIPTIIPFIYRIKIGKSRNIIKRLLTHRTALGYVYLLGVVPVKNIQYAENYILNRFKHLRYNTTELFYFSIWLLLFILSIRNKSITSKLQKRLNKYL